MRQKISLIIFLLILSAVFYITIYPFIFRYYDVKHFCDSLTYRGLNSLHKIKEQAILEGFSYVENKKENRLTVYDKKTIGKTTCFIVDDNGKISAIYMGE